MKYLMIFDIDGTLMSCGGSGRQAMNDAFYEVFQIENGFERVEMAGRLDRAILRRSLEINRVALSDEAAFFSLYGHHLIQRLSVNRDLKVYPGISTLLEMLSQRHDVLCALGTGNCEIGAYEKLKAVGLNHHFVLGGYGDHHDSRAQLIQHVVDQAQLRFGHHYDPSKIMVIGDTPFDIESGKAVGAKTVAVATGHYALEALEACRPDFVTEDFSDPAAFLKRIGMG